MPQGSSFDITRERVVSKRKGFKDTISSVYEVKPEHPMGWEVPNKIPSVSSTYFLEQN